MMKTLSERIGQLTALWVDSPHEDVKAEVIEALERYRFQSRLAERESGSAVGGAAARALPADVDALALLIARLEKLTEPDREVDCRISCIVAGVEFVSVEDSGNSRRVEYNGGTPPVHIPWVDYTASIDAALSLVPEGCRTWVVRGGARTPSASVNGNMEDGANPAIALCIAALKARADEARAAAPETTLTKPSRDGEERT